jgi:hypothetical protein
MSKKENNIFKFLKGEFLLNEAAGKSWRMILFVIGLMMLMVRSGHVTDEQVLKIAKLSKKEQELRAEYIAIRSKAMRLKLESNVIAKVETLGLKPSKEPAIVIKENKQKER